MWLQCGLFCDGAVTWRHCPAHISTLAAADQHTEYRGERVTADGRSVQTGRNYPAI